MPNRREPKTRPGSVSGHRRRREAADSGEFEAMTGCRRGGPSSRPEPERTYYTDPATGYIFHSVKDALRYVETGDLGQLASKPKDKGNDDVELDDDNASPAAIGKKQRIADAGDHNKELSSKLEVIEKDNGSLKSSIFTEENPPRSGHTSDECVVDAELRFAGLRKSKDPEEIEKQTDLPRMESVSSSAVGALPEKEPLGNSSKKRPYRKPKDKRISNLPRRTSKRLSGVEVDPGLQIKPNVRAHRVTVQESRVAKGNNQKTPATATLCHEPSGKIDQPKSRLETDSTSVTSTSILPSLGKHARKLETESEGFEMKICSSMLPQGGNPETHFMGVEEADEKSRSSSFNLPFDILNDPCIEFAIKTLTGTSFDASEAIECSKKLAVEQQFPIHSGKEFQTKNKEVTPVDLPCKDFWTDPCIEFAVKTLTGAIPLEYDMNMHGSSQQLSSSQTQGNNELTLPHVDIYRSDFFSTQLTTVDKPVFKQQAGSDGAFHGDSDRKQMSALL